MSLMEVMVVIVISLVLIAVMVPATRSVFQLEQRKAAKTLAITYERLHDEAVMRNRTYRIIYYLNENRYVVEAGEPGALISATPEHREAFEQEMRAKLALMDDEEKQRWKSRNRQPFKSMGSDGRMQVQLPNHIRIAGIYTPQYGELVTPDGEDDWDPEKEEGQRQRVISYVMSNGFSEHTIIHLVDPSDPEDGWTVEVEPLSGNVHLYGELIDWKDRADFIPDEGPDLPN